MSNFKVVIASTILAISSGPALSGDLTRAAEQIEKGGPNKSFAFGNGSPKLTKSQALAIKQKSASNRLMVRLDKGVSSANFSSMLKNQVPGAKVIKSFPTLVNGQKQQIVVLDLTNAQNKDTAVNFLKAGADKVSQDSVVTLNAIPNDELFDNLWGMHNTSQTGGSDDADIDAQFAWNRVTGSNDVVVGIIDTGIDDGHPDLADNIWRNSAEVNGITGVDDDGNGYIDDFYGIDTVNFDSDPDDDAGHGTHVAGTIGAVGNNSIGVVGVNWQVKLAACKFLDAYGSGYTSDAIECISYFNALKASGVNVKVTNNSWGGGGADTLLEDAIAEANNQQIVFVAAAGNSSDNNDYYPSYPASYQLPNVVSVAATNHYDELAYFSNYGASSVHLAAPGSEILSTIPESGSSDTNCGRVNKVLFGESFESRLIWSLNSFALESVDPSVSSFSVITDTDAKHGTYSLDDSATGDYTNYTRSIAIGRRTSDLSNAQSSCVQAQVWVNGATENGYDYLNVYGSPDSGSTWHLLGYASGSTNGWEAATFSIPEALHTSTFRLALERTNDYSIVYEGYKLDFVRIIQRDTDGQSTGSYDTYSGTSMAAPHVAGAVSLIGACQDFTPAQIVSRLMVKTDPLSSLSGSVISGGRLNLNKFIGHACTN